MNLRKVQLPHGIELAYVDEGSGPVILLLHGFPLDHSMWDETIVALSPHFRVLAPDLRGHGASQATSGKVLMSDMADDMALLLEQNKINEPITSIGLSMGGYVAWEFWRRHRQRLQQWVLCDTRAVADRIEVARGREMMAAQVLTEGAQIAADAMLPKFFTERDRLEKPDLIRRVEAMILATSSIGIAAAQRGMAERADFQSQLGHMNLPTLVVCGEHDRISPPEEMREIAAAMPQATFQIIANSGHLPPLENPDEFHSVLLRFLTR